MHFELITPERVVFRQDVDQVTLPTAAGEITILPNHVPLVTALVAGIARLKTQGKDEEVAVSGGFIEVAQDNVRVLADTAERGEELNMSAIEQAKERAQKVMREAVKEDDKSYAAAMAAVEREMARYKLAKRYKSPKHTPTIDSATLPPDADRG